MRKVSASLLSFAYTDREILIGCLSEVDSTSQGVSDTYPRVFLSALHSIAGRSNHSDKVMSESNNQYARYEHDRRPIAIQHQGMFVYANPAFLNLVGLSTFEDLEAIPVLDLVADRHRQRLREHFDQAETVPKSSKTYPKAKLTLIKPDGTHQVVHINSCHTRFGGEDTIEFYFQTQDDFALKNRVFDLPWKLYFSVLFLLVFTILPTSLLLNLNINNAPKVYLPEDAPSVLIDNKLREQFPQ